MDTLSTLLGRFPFNARVFFHGDFCGANGFEPDGTSGHLHLVRKGPVVFAHEQGASLRVEEPTLVFYPRGTKHELRVPDGVVATLLCAQVSFQGGVNPLARVLPDCMVLPLKDMAPMTLDLLFAEAATCAQGCEAILDRLCDVLMIQLIRHAFERGSLDLGMLAGLADRQLAPVLDAMHERPHEPWNLHALARLACMSRARFTEHFRNVIGTPPVEYLTRWRIGLACRLLRDGLPVKVVSAQAGYMSPPAFTRAFTEHLGMSPRQWMRERHAAAVPA